MVSLTHTIVCPTFGKATSKKFWNGNQMHTRTLGYTYYRDETATLFPVGFTSSFPTWSCGAHLWCNDKALDYNMNGDIKFQDGLGFNPRWVVHASRVFIPTSPLWFSEFPLAHKLIFHANKPLVPLPSSKLFFFFNPVGFPLFLIVGRNTVVWGKHVLWLGYHSHCKMAYLFWQIASDWKNAVEPRI